MAFDSNQGGAYSTPGCAIPDDPLASTAAFDGSASAIYGAEWANMTLPDTPLAPSSEPDQYERYSAQLREQQRRQYHQLLVREEQQQRRQADQQQQEQQAELESQREFLWDVGSFDRLEKSERSCLEQAGNEFQFQVDLQQRFAPRLELQELEDDLVQQENQQPLQSTPMTYETPSTQQQQVCDGTFSQNVQDQPHSMRQQHHQQNHQQQQQQRQQRHSPQVQQQQPQHKKQRHDDHQDRHHHHEQAQQQQPLSDGQRDDVQWNAASTKDLQGLADLCHQQSISNLRLQQQHFEQTQELDLQHQQEQQEYIKRIGIPHHEVPMMMSTRVDGEVADDSSSSGSSDDGMGPESPSPVIAHYELIVRQQPVRARMSGYNNKDRRPIDPTPIVQLTARSAEGKQLDVSYLKSPFMVLYASLWSADKTTEFTFGFGDSQIPPNSNDNTPPPPQPPPSQVSATIRVDNVTHFPMASSPSSQSHSSSSISDEKPTILEGIQQSSLSSSSSSNGEAPRVNAAAARAPKPLAPPLPVLLGSLVSSCYILRDENGMKGLFFVFPDMGVRTSGKYRLKFNLFVVEAVDLGFRLTQAAEAAQAAASPSSAGLDDDSLKKTKVKTSFPSSSKSPCASVFSNVFKVYSPKSFPGMAASTALSKLFAKQGVRIHLRADAHTQRGDPNRNPQHRHSKSGGSSGAGGGSSGT